MKFDVPYGFSRRLRGVDMAKAKDRVTEALKTEGFGVLTEIDVQATFKKKLDVDRPPYVILGACNPGLAKKAIDGAPGVGLLLPCNVVLAQDGDEVVVAFASPKSMFEIAGDDTLAPVADEAEERLRHALSKV